MNVRICGPNLTGGAQAKGTFHVHAATCNDLNYYGPGRKYGSDVLGTRDLLVEHATITKIVMISYADQIGEAIADEQYATVAEAVADYASEFWIAPCCGNLPHGEVIDEPSAPTTAEPEAPDDPFVYECWVTGMKDSFVKLHDVEDVGEWVKNSLSTDDMCGHLCIGKHRTSSYTNIAQAR